MIKKAYTIQMTYSVSDDEKRQAERVLMCLKDAKKKLETASLHLDIMKIPFKDKPDIKPSEIMDARAAIRRFRDKSVDNFNSFKHSAFQCVNLMQSFASDTQTIKLMKSLISSIDDLESKVNKFVDFFDKLEDKEFSKNVVKAMEDIQKQCGSIEEIIDNRIKDHIEKNILASSWVDSVSKELQVKIEKKTPLILELFNKRQDQLNEVLSKNK
jgi:hypothetical protein